MLRRIQRLRKPATAAQCRLFPTVSRRSLVSLANGTRTKGNFLAKIEQTQPVLLCICSCRHAWACFGQPCDVQRDDKCWLARRSLELVAWHARLSLESIPNGAVGVREGESARRHPLRHSGAARQSLPEAEATNCVQGPKIRVGRMKEPFKLSIGDTIRVTSQDIGLGTRERIQVCRCDTVVCSLLPSFAADRV